MKAQAYVLISVQVGHARQVYQELTNIGEIKHVDAVSGPFDMIASVEAFDTIALGKLVIDRIQSIEGIADTITCHVISLEN
jgi:DNA-binding Lrp family transcriptional regulator